MPIRFSQIQRLDDGFLIDPRPYQAELPKFRESLPSGAVEFICAPEHFDIHSERAVKDLEVEKFTGIDGSAALTLIMELSYNQRPGVSRLSIEYQDVLGVSIEIPSTFSMPADWITPETRRLGTVLTDEVLPHPHGCIHEIAMIHGSISVICRDLCAVWSTNLDHSRG